MAKLKIKSPYLDNDNRLADVIAAIQILGMHKRYKLSVIGWTERITRKEENVEYWKKVFQDHPEFFRFSPDGRVSLVWRRRYKWNYDIDTEEIVPHDKLMELKEKNIEKYHKGMSRKPLTDSNVETLIDTAIKMHSRALEHQKSTDWWKPSIAAFLGAVIGALIQSLSVGG